MRLPWGAYQFLQVSPGTYNVVVHLHALTDEGRTVQVKAGETATLDFQLRLPPLRQDITVTASGREETTFESFQAVNTVESLELAEKSETSIGEVLENEPGVAKRSFGPDRHSLGHPHPAGCGCGNTRRPQPQFRDPGERATQDRGHL